ncbi:gamma-glutamyltransferase [Actinoallomurus sp. NPDC052274]|uniref:gamma-glutamyltransferase n=1 Tax=Actinoallomurus sp. NPDC052274 TaxID=3155420 RepID=UPI00344A8194
MRLRRRSFLQIGGAAMGLAALGGAANPDVASASRAVRRTTGAGGPSPTPFGRPTDSIPNPGGRITAVRGDRASNWPNQTRSEIVARHGAVATSQPIAAQAGLRILQQGGNAVDAAVATAAVLGLVEPESAGLGGDLFAVYYSAKHRKLFGLNSSGWSPNAWDLDYFHARGFDEKTGMPERGVDSISVPGAVEGWHRLLERFGTRGFDVVLEPAATLAEQGFGITEQIHSDWEDAVDVLKTDADSVRVFLRDGKAPPLYGIFRNPDLAHAYRALQRKGRDAFYTGEIADAIVAKIKKLNGAMTSADLAEFHAEWVEPISINYHGYDVYEIPPNTQGFAALEMLNILQQCGPVLGLDLADLGPRSPEFWHLLVEAKKLAYDDLYTYNGDPRFTSVPLGRLLSTEYAIAQCKKINPRRATPPRVRASNISGTVYVAVADRWGNMVSFIYSVFELFGSGVTVPGYGFPLQNRGSQFSLDPSSPNVVAPHKRPFHTLIPAFVMQNGHPVMAFGNVGGSEQAQAQATEIINMVDLGMNPQAAADAARFNHDQKTDVLQLEPELLNLVGRQLSAMGHHVTKSVDSAMGGFQAIVFDREAGGDRREHAQEQAQEQEQTQAQAAGRAATGGTSPSPVNGVYRAASDHRKDGSAVGW